MHFQTASLILIAFGATAQAVFDHSPKFGSPDFKPYYLSPHPYGSSYEKYDDKAPQYDKTYYTSYNPGSSYNHETYEPKYDNYNRYETQGKEHIPSAPYYGAYYNSAPNDYHMSAYNKPIYYAHK